MFRYLVFGGQGYYASGGCYDLIGKYSENHLNEALELAKSVEGKYLITTDSEYGDEPWYNSHECEWARVYDLYEDKVIYNVGGIHGTEALVIAISDSPYKNN